MNELKFTLNIHIKKDRCNRHREHELVYLIIDHLYGEKSHSKGRRASRLSVFPTLNKHKIAYNSQRINHLTQNPILFCTPISRS